MAEVWGDGDVPVIDCRITRAWWAWYRNEISFEQYRALAEQAIREAEEAAGEESGCPPPAPGPG